MSVTVAFVRETAPGERRISLTPETCKKLLASKARVLLEAGAGVPASFPDAAYAGAEFLADRQAVLAQADILVCVQPPSNVELASLKPGAIVPRTCMLVSSLQRSIRLGVTSPVIS